MKNLSAVVEIYGEVFQREFYIDFRDVDELDDIEKIMKKALKEKGYEVRG